MWPDLPTGTRLYAGSGGLRYPARMAESSRQSIVIDAPVAQVAEVICDFDRYPEWTGAVRTAEVLEEYEDGYASQVRFQLDAGPVRDEYVLAYEYAEDLSLIEWRLVGSSTMQRTQNGSYEIADNGNGTCTVTYTLEVELTVPMLGMFRRKAEKMIMDTALKELKRRVESQPAEPEGGGDERSGR
jgi:ribosome-associated toxin RatA of RatAB toxin-antitoxin module